MEMKPGDLVLCVDDSLKSSNPPPGVRFSDDMSGLRAGRIYTLRDVGLRFRLLPLDHVRLEEIHRAIGPAYDDQESAFLTSRFRPLSSERLAIFRQLLVDVPRTENVEA